ncbi:MAG: branched-chain amino acid transaminase [Acidobacteriota bacterium]|jgi:branched-chain amino acid aminotransferase
MVPKTDWIWLNGEFVRWEDAKIHILSHVIHYGTGVFEGIRCYETPKGPQVMRLQDHIKRLYNSAKIYRMELEMSRDEYSELCLELIRRNNMSACYIRPLIYRGSGSMGVNPLNCSVDSAVAVWDWGAYLGPEALSKGVDVCVSTWNRVAPNTFPAMAKATANYMNGGLIKMEAIVNGFVEGIALDSQGYIGEGSGENLFMVLDDKVYTPPLSSGILPGITRDSVITLFEKEMGLTVHEKPLNREMLYICDELFFCGTAAEVTPIATVDKIKVGKGSRGPVTEEVQRRYLSLVKGEREDPYGWLTPVRS